ncbi:MAG: hypothetical protein LBS99_07360 [Clostridiales bacterium]|jgi:hypothetical protein|nr:hypothetical protein [Clostridiales bacterium]
MFNANDIIDKDLKDGREYLYVGGMRYRLGDCFLQSGREITVKEICDQVHFVDDRSQFWHTHMFYDRKCEHCPERNAGKVTQDRTPAAVLADNVRTERDAFRAAAIKNSPDQVYDDYARIHFCEKMCWYLVKRGHKPSTKDSEALLKCGDKLLTKLYWRFIDCPNASVDTDKGVEDFLKGCINQNQLF